MPKGLSGKKMIERYLSTNFGGPFTPIDPSQFKTLSGAEGMIKSRAVEHLVVFDDISKQAIVAGYGSSSSVGVPGGVDYTGKTVTHNHPGIYGGTLSFADVTFATGYNVKSMRAVGANKKEGTYILRKGRNANPTGLNSRIAKDRPMLERKMTAVYNKHKDKTTVFFAQEYTGILDSYYKSVVSQYGYVYAKQGD